MFIEGFMVMYGDEWYCGNTNAMNLPFGMVEIQAIRMVKTGLFVLGPSSYYIFSDCDLLVAAT